MFPKKLKVKERNRKKKEKRKRKKNKIMKEKVFFFSLIVKKN